MNSGRSSITGLVFGGIMAALAVACAVVPLLGLFIPIPLVLAYVRYGGRVAVLTAVVSTNFAAFFMGPLRTLLLIPGGILPGLVFGYGFKHKWRAVSIAMAATTVLFAGVTLDYVLLRAALGGRDPVSMVMGSDRVRQRLEGQAAALEQWFGTENLYGHYIEGLRENSGSLLWGLLPAALFIGGAVVSTGIYGICRFLLVRFGHEVPTPTPFQELRFPTWLVWTVALPAVALSLFGPSPALISWWLQVILSVMETLALALVPLGIAAVYGYLIKKDVPWPAAFLLALAGLLFRGFGTYIYVAVALWDSIFDVRGLGHGFPKSPNIHRRRGAPDIQEGRGA